jgi:hypothetical protein
LNIEFYNNEQNIITEILRDLFHNKNINTQQYKTQKGKLKHNSIEVINWLRKRNLYDLYVQKLNERKNLIHIVKTYRKNPIKFCENYLGIKLKWYQKLMLRKEQYHERIKRYHIM